MAAARSASVPTTTVIDDQLRAGAGSGKTIFMSDAFRTAPRRSRQSSDLTDREVQVLTLVSHGKTNKQIGAVLYLSPATIHSHLKKVFRKLDANDRAHAVAQAFRAGMLQ
jgi:DNA-binding NarL/FixJ family response regulator